MYEILGEILINDYLYFLKYKNVVNYSYEITTDCLIYYL